MATQIMSDAERDKLQAFPQISREELVRYFTLTPADEGFLAAHRRPANRLGLAVQLCTLPWLGFVPDNVASAPAPAVARLAEQASDEERYGNWRCGGGDRSSGACKPLI